MSLWEIAIKHALARGDMPLSVAQAITWAQECGFELLPLDLPHLLTLEQLPLHHRDPFDRLLVAQSIAESLLLVSADRAAQLDGWWEIWFRAIPAHNPGVDGAPPARCPAASREPGARCRR